MPDDTTVTGPTDVAELAAWLDEMGLDPEQVGDGRVHVAVTGHWRRGMPVDLRLGDRHLRFQALLAGAVEEHHEELYEFLLERNETAGDVRFALDNEGDVLLVGRLPRRAVDRAALDELFGELVTTAEETFNRILGTGFASYVGKEQAWRAASGAPDNPAFPSDRGTGQQDGADGGDQ